MNMDVSICAICNENSRVNNLGNEDEMKCIKKKAINALSEKSKKLRDKKYLKWAGLVDLYIHKGCYKKYSNMSIPKTSHKLSSSLLGNSSASGVNDSYEFEDENTFNFKAHCLFCCQDWSPDDGHEVDRPLLNKMLLTMINNLKGHEELKDRISGIDSLMDVYARFHQSCYESVSAMAPDEDSERQEAFEKVCRYLQSHKGQGVPYSTLTTVMGNYKFEARVLQRNLKNKYGNDFHYWSQTGKQSLYFYKRQYLIESCSDWMIDDSSLGGDQENLILSIAASILHKKIVNTEYNLDYYNSPGEFLAGVKTDIPKQLLNFLILLIYPDDTNKLYEKKILHIAHSLVRLCKPNKFNSHLHLALSTYILRKTGSKLVIDILASLGICSSYHSTQLFEASCVKNTPEIDTGDTFIQLVFDNTDHNTQTLTGKDTFHCMGSISIHTPKEQVTWTSKIKKLKVMPSEEELVAGNTISATYLPASYRGGLSKIEFVDTDDYIYEVPDPLPSSYCAFLWGHYYKIPNLPSWKGYMEVLARDSSYYVSRILCNPFIKLKPTEPTTIYTSIMYAIKETKKKNQKTVLITFDQPLYIKAREIKAGIYGEYEKQEEQEQPQVVILLGLFHLLMSWLGALGYIMNGSGLEDMFGTVYGENAVTKLLTGHVFDRAMRAHTLAFIAIGKIICECAVQDKYKEHEPYIVNFFKNWSSLEDAPRMGDSEVDPRIKQFKKMFLKQLDTFKKNGPTANLWIQYFEALIITFRFYEASRLGHWDLLLSSIRQMLPFFHAAHHFPYAKCAQIFLQDMENLAKTMDPVEYHKFTSDAMFTIRRSDKAFSGIWADMTIEQTLNRFFGTDLVHGRGVTDGVITKYLNSMPLAYEVMNGLEDFTGINSRRSEQHKDLTNSRIIQDEEDVEKFFYWLKTHQPFIQRDSLMSLSTGIIGTPDINCHQAVAKGKAAMKKMVGQNAETVTLSKMDGVKNLDEAVSLLHTPEELVNVDHLAFFKKISPFLQSDNEVSRIALQYELTPFPLSLFDKDGYMRNAEKYKLCEALNNGICVKPSSNDVSDDSVIVLDGGFLLHRVVWPHGSTYGKICANYLNYLKKSYAHHFEKKNLYIVFDGYNNESVGVKSYERYRRKQKNVAVDINIEYDTLATFSQKCFLTNICNKRKFIGMLAQHLKDYVHVFQAEEDADTLIVQTALNIRKTTLLPVTVIGNDTDLLILLIGNTSEYDEDIYFQKISTLKKEKEMYQISLYHEFKPFILFLHAFSGCDTTSAPFSITKLSIVTYMRKYPESQVLAQVFTQPNATKEDVQSAAKKLIAHYYMTKNKISPKEGESDIELINRTRYSVFYGSNIFDAEKRLNKLPPTIPAINQHALRVYYQIQRWLGNELDPLEWGWKKIDTLLVPIMSTEPPAPDELLQMHNCGCNVICKKTCGCRKAGLKCSQYCKKCKGTNCGNDGKITGQTLLKEISRDPTEVSDHLSGDDNEDNENSNQDVRIPSWLENLRKKYTYQEH